MVQLRAHDGLEDAVMPLARLELRLTSDPAQIAPARRAVETWATAAGFTRKTIADLGLCLNEALANVIRHAYADQPQKAIHVALELVSAAPNLAVRVSIRDWGCGVDPTQLRQRAYDPLIPGGLGMICLRSLMDHVAFSPQSDGMLLTMLKINQPESPI